MLVDKKSKLYEDIKDIIENDEVNSNEDWYEGLLNYFCLADNGYSPNANQSLQIPDDQFDEMFDEWLDSKNCEDWDMVLNMLRSDITLDEFTQVISTVMLKHTIGKFAMGCKELTPYIKSEFAQAMPEFEKVHPFGHIDEDFIKQIFKLNKTLEQRLDTFLINIYVALQNGNVNIDDKDALIKKVQAWLQTWQGQEYVIGIHQILTNNIEDPESILVTLNTLAINQKEGKHSVEIDSKFQEKEKGNYEDEDDEGAW